MGKLLLFKHNHDIMLCDSVSEICKGGRCVKQQAQRKPVSAEQHNKMIQSVAGTMAIEGLTLSEASRRNLDRYASGQANYQQIIAELKEKYQRAE